MKRILASVAVLALCGQAVAAPVFGTFDGCQEYAADAGLPMSDIGPIDEASPVYVISDTIHFPEDTCRLAPPVNYTGTPMSAVCDGESGPITEMITLKSVGEALLFNERLTLHRCEFVEPDASS